MDYFYTLNLQVQANTIMDLLRTVDEVKIQIADGQAMAHDKDETRRYALSIEEEKPFEPPECWELKD